VELHCIAKEAAMFTHPLMYLPLLWYRAWLETFCKPVIKEAQENVEAAETVVATMQTHSTPV
jgi:hypothetical protein